MIFTDCFKEKKNNFTAQNVIKKDQSRSELEITKMFNERNQEYIKKYGGLFRKFDVRALKEKIWKSYNHVN